MTDVKLKSRDGRDDLGLFIHSALDEYGLDPYEFRVYCRIARRAGVGQCWESIANMAAAIGIGEQRLKEALTLLKTCHLITVQHQPGGTSVITLRPMREWEPKTEITSKRTLSKLHKARRGHLGVKDTQVSLTPNTQVSLTPTKDIPKGYPSKDHLSLKNKLHSLERDGEHCKTRNAPQPPSISDLKSPQGQERCSSSEQPFLEQQCSSAATKGAAARKGNTPRVQGRHSPPAKQTDPRCQHPAIIAVRHLMKSFPNKEQYDIIIECIGSTIDEERLKRSWRAWVSRGYNPRNIGWIMEWYAKDAIPNGGGYQNGHNRQDSVRPGDLPGQSWTDGYVEQLIEQKKRDGTYLDCTIDTGEEVDLRPWYQIKRELDAIAAGKSS